MESFGMQQHLYEYRRDSMAGADCWHSRNDQCPPHYHSSIEVVYVRSGTLHAVLDGQPLEVSAGHLLIVSGYVVHAYQSPQKNDDLLLIIPPSFVPSLQKALLDSVFSVPVYDLRGDAPLRAVLSLIEKDWSAYSVETRRGLCHTLLSLLIERVGLSSVQRSARQGLMKDVLIYLQNNYQSSQDLATLARRFGYSKSRFSHLFNETLGCPPGAFVNGLRCQHAAQEMLAGGRKMLDIALAAGFDCPRTFYRAFKQYYGMTPTQYMKQHTQK